MSYKEEVDKRTALSRTLKNHLNDKQRLIKDPFYTHLIKVISFSLITRPIIMINIQAKAMHVPLDSKDE